jgi:D-amino-acid dehydrogenase
MLRSAVRMVLDPRSPVFIRLRLDPALLPFLIRFAAACSRERFIASMDTLCAIGREAGTCFRDLVEAERIDCGHSATGWLEVFRNPAHYEAALPLADMLRERGYQVLERKGDAFHRAEPAFLDSVHGGLLFQDSAFAHPGRFMDGLAAAVRRHGGTIRESCEAVRIDCAGGRFQAVETTTGETVQGDDLVLAAGAWSTRLARTCGLSIPLQGGKGYHLVLDGTPHRPTTTSVLAESFVAVTPLDGGLRLAGTVELAGLDLAMNDARCRQLLRGGSDYIRGIDQAKVTSTWCGLRPLTASGLPAIGWGRETRRVFVATGHAMMGFLLGPLTGRLAAEAILDGTTSLDLSPFDLDGRLVPPSAGSSPPPSR